MSQIAAQDLHILLIEPSAVQRKIIMQQLEGEQVMAIDAVCTKAQAHDFIRRIRPDLVVTALHYEDGSAGELLTELRNDPQFSDIPFMLISSETRHAQLEVFKQSGVVAILPKPFTPQHLGAALNATLDLLSHDDVELELYDVDNIRILLVDDSGLARRHLRRVLENLGIRQILEASDGSEAIKLLQREMVDMVVTDYNMPEVNGADLANFIRHSEAYVHLPILMVTSENSEATLRHISQSGVDALTDKPFEPETVKQILVRLLDRQ